MKKEFKSPINWYGGKFYMADSIISLFPEHKIYCEVFGGAGHILFTKPSSGIEIYKNLICQKKMVLFKYYYYYYCLLYFMWGTPRLGK